ncbi:hypothetical protein NX774_04335 [Massilia agilis]|uniref:Uncharacterized protein n=1 Tax=Massilia agilis TaxID=1811226 RepID=A0ABT2D759_9BURK|nr:hypothetical protein [Massilia agilis]MCS0807146.1 hypothetical protein [Massilia agilis]
MNQQIELHHLSGTSTVSYFMHVLDDAGVPSKDASVLTLGKGHFFGLLPPGVPTQRIRQFNHAGILPAGPLVEVPDGMVQEVTPPFEAIARLLAKRLDGYERPVLWVHEPMMQEDEIQREHLAYKRLGGQLYLAYDDLREKKIAKALRFSMLSWHFLAFVTDQTRQVESVDSLLALTKMILVGAYDGESVLLWERGA